jgi:PAS domain S-box-containing protein
MADGLETGFSGVLDEHHSQLVETHLSIFLSLAFDNHHSLHPRRIRELAREMTDFFLEYAKGRPEAVPEEYGRTLLLEGLGARTLLALGRELQRFCRSSLSGRSIEALAAGLEVAARYHEQLMAGYLEEREVNILQKQEQLRRALSAALERQRRELYIKEHAINTSINGIMLTDLKGRISYVNSAFLTMWGFDQPGEVLGKAGHDFWDSPELDQTIDLFQELDTEGRQGWRGEYIARRKDDTCFEVEVSVSLIRDDQGQPVGLMISFIDITDRKLAESELRRLEEHLFQSQKIEAIGTLASGIAHDFNNILQAISGYIQLVLNKGHIDLASHNYLNEVDFAVERASDLVHRLLTFSRKVQPSLKPVELNAEVVRTVKMLERTIPKMISIEMRLAGDLTMVNGDANQLEQVLMNLGSNARDSMPYGGRLVIETRNIILDEAFCKVHPETEPGHYALVRVMDTGRGINQETMAHIFEPFFTTKGVGEGTGLGLSTVYGIVKNHGGHIICHSQVGQGTNFDLYFPASKSKKAAPSQVRGPVEEVRGGHETIMVVDDEKTILEIAEDILQEYGYRTITADSGEMLLDIYRRQGQEIDLVILDLGMPGRGGLTSLKDLLVMDRKARVIIASGYSADGQVRECLERGAVGFIPKPYRLLDMLRKVREVLDAGLDCPPPHMPAGQTL